jgi:hypothetical protein
MPREYPKRVLALNGLGTLGCSENWGGIFFGSADSAVSKPCPVVRAVVKSASAPYYRASYSRHIRLVIVVVPRAVADNTLVADDHKVGLAQSIKPLQRTRPHQQRKGDSGALEKPPLDQFWRPVPHVNADGLKIGSFEFLPDPFDSRSLRDAEVSPIPEEIDQHDLASEVAKGELTAPEKLQPKVRRWSPFLGTLASAGPSRRREQPSAMAAILSKNSIFILPSQSIRMRNNRPLI